MSENLGLEGYSAKAIERIQERLLFDFWGAESGLACLAGGLSNSEGNVLPLRFCNEFLSQERKDAETKKMLETGNLNDSRVVQIKTANYLSALLMQSNLDTLLDCWKHSIHPNETVYLSGKRDDPLSLRYSPEYFIDWALSKRFRPDWLDWAIEQKLYTPKERRNLPAPAQNTPAAPEFDKASPTYPPELACALEAWRAVSATEGKSKPKARIKAWLDTNTKLSDKAKERIAVVANWEKLGGATSTE